MTMPQPSSFLTGSLPSRCSRVIGQPGHRYKPGQPRWSRSQVRHDGPQMRRVPLTGRFCVTAGNRCNMSRQRRVGTTEMRWVRVAQRANDGHIVRACRQSRQQFTNLQPRCGRGDRRKLSADTVGRKRLGVQRIEMARPAPQKDKNTAFRSPKCRTCRCRPGEGSVHRRQSPSQRGTHPRPQHIAPRWRRSSKY